MTTLNFQITTAGRQAAIDADATGLQLTITEVGYGNGTWSPDASATALQDEFKRRPAGGGDNPAPLYVHVTALDESSETYQANEVGIYAGNVLFAIWSKGLQPDTDGPGKINTQDSAFAFDLLLTDVPPGSVTVGDTNFSMPRGTEDRVGVWKEASLQQVLDAAAGLVLTPEKLHAWFQQQQFRYAGELAIFSTPTLPAGFPGFVLDGSTIPNGVNDFPELAASGSRFITISGNNIILLDVPDVLRGQGSSDREVGEFQPDAMRKLTGKIINRTTNNQQSVIVGADGVFETGIDTESLPEHGTISYTSILKQLERTTIDSSRQVPTAPEFRMKSTTALFAIYHGKVAA